MSNNDYYALDTVNNYVYIIHPVTKNDENYSTAEKLVLKDASSVVKEETSTIYETIQFATGDTISISDFNDENIVGLYAFKVKTDTVPTAPTKTDGYSWVLE